MKLVGLLVVALAALVAPASASARFVQLDQPVLMPTQAWEGIAVQEPTVMYENGRYRMWYSGGFWHCAVGYAESDDGIHWRKRKGPILGHGRGGEPGVACHSSVVKHRDVYYLYYADDDQTETLRVATSRDGVHFKKGPIVLRPQSWALRIANTAVWVEQGQWRMLFESHLTGDRFWATSLARGTGPYRWSISPHGPLETLGVTDTGMFGGPWLMREGAHYRLYYHAARHSTLPTDIYTATSTDLRSWKRGPMLVGRDRPWEVDQVADPSVLRVGCRTLMWFSGMDNRPGSESGRIGLAIDDRCPSRGR